MKGKTVTQRLRNLFMGSDEEESPKTTQEALQDAARRDMELANAKGEAATVQIVTATAGRKELGKLVVQHKELQRQALLAEKAKDPEKAKKILALVLAIKQKIEDSTEYVERSSKIATQLIESARKQYKQAEFSTQDLPRKVLQLEVNGMLEDARKLETDIKARFKGKESFQALAASIELSTERLMIRELISEEGTSLDEDVARVLQESTFEEEYLKLQQAAQTEGEIIEAEIIEDNGVSKAIELLSSPAFGGLVSGLDETVTKKKPIEHVPQS